MSDVSYIMLLPCVSRSHVPESLATPSSGGDTAVP